MTPSNPNIYYQEQLPYSNFQRLPQPVYVAPQQPYQQVVHQTVLQQPHIYSILINVWHLLLIHISATGSVLCVSRTAAVCSPNTCLNVKLSTSVASTYFLRNDASILSISYYSLTDCVRYAWSRILLPTTVAASTHWTVCSTITTYTPNTPSSICASTSSTNRSNGTEVLNWIKSYPRIYSKWNEKKKCKIKVWNRFFVY